MISFDMVMPVSCYHYLEAFWPDAWLVNVSTKTNKEKRMTTMTKTATIATTTTEATNNEYIATIVNN